jgi:hypothetical protein
MEQPITIIQILDALRNSLVESSELKQQVAVLTLQIAELTGRLTEVESRILSAEVPMPPCPPVAPAKKELQFYSLINQDVWKKNWHKCFDQERASEAEVRVGDTGSIGIGYGILSSLRDLIADKSENEAIAALIAAAPKVRHTNKELSKYQCATAVLPFYALATGKNGTLFGLKQGTKATWVVEKIGDYYHAPPADRASAPLVSDWQKTDNYFEHRFAFRVVAIVSEEERKIPHHLQLIKTHAVTF